MCKDEFVFALGDYIGGVNLSTFESLDFKNVDFQKLVDSKLLSKEQVKIIKRALSMFYFTIAFEEGVFSY